MSKQQQSLLIGTALCACLAAVPHPANAQGDAVRVAVRIFEKPAGYPFVDHDDNDMTPPQRVPAETETDSVAEGEDFVVKVIIQDIRANAEGVFSTYIDLNLQPESLATLIDPLPFTLHPQTSMPTAYLYDTDIYGRGAEPSENNGLIDTDSSGTPDQIDVLGSFSDTLFGPGPGEKVLLEFAMTAEQEGHLTLELEPTTEDPEVDPNDEGGSPLYDAFVYGQDEPVCPSQSLTPCIGSMVFESDSIMIIAGSPPSDAWGVD